MKIRETALPGVTLIEPAVHRDERGYFFEAFHEARYAEEGLPARFVQDNFSFSTRGVLRGLHFQQPAPQGKLVYVLQGEIFDVAVDVRVGSPHFGKWVGATLSSGNHQQLFVPEGFAHGFCVTSDTALVAYKCTSPYAPGGDQCLIWNDPEIGIAWPVSTPRLSAKDALGASLSALRDRGTLPELAPAR